MDFYKTTAAFGATACLLMASTALGDAIKSETFESDEGGWVGGTNRVTATYTAPSVAGLPISASLTNPNHVLEVVGSATNEVAAAAGDALVDMMVKVSKPDTALDGLDAGNSPKFAVAVDTDGKFKYWNWNGTTGAWVALSATEYNDDDWVRLTMKFYYSLGKCVVALDGNTCSVGGETALNLIDTSATALASIEVKGSTALDEVLVTQDTMVAAFSGHSAKIPAAGGGDSIVTKEWLTAFNKTWPDSASADLVSQYTLGLDPNGTATTMPLSFEQDADDDKATLSFPGFGAFGGTGTYVLKSSTDKTNWTGNTVVTPSGTGVNTAQISLNSLTAGTAVYYRIEASATAPSNN